MMFWKYSHVALSFVALLLFLPGSHSPTCGSVSPGCRILSVCDLLYLSVTQLAIGPTPHWSLLTPRSDPQGPEIDLLGISVCLTVYDESSFSFVPSLQSCIFSPRSRIVTVLLAPSYWVIWHKNVYKLHMHLYSNQTVGKRDQWI